MNKYRFFNQNLTVCISKLTFLFNSSGAVRYLTTSCFLTQITFQGDDRHLRPGTQSERE